MSDRTIAVVDGNSLLHRAFHALPETMTAPDGRPTNAAFGFISMLIKLVADLRPDGVVVAFDCGKPAFRIAVLEQYKVHRPPTAAALKIQFPMVKKLLEALAVPIVEVEGWEGDDILGTVARRCETAGVRVLLVTGDRDALQLVTDRVSVVTTRKGITDIVVYGPAEVEERYGITPEQVPDYLGLKGDTSDNIPGVPGIGEKTAAKLLQEYGTLEEVLAHAADVGGRAGANLETHAEEALASRTVATIACDVPFELDLDSAEFGGFDLAELAAAFGELRFTTLLERVLALRSDEGAAVARGATATEEAAAPACAADARPARPVLRGAEGRSQIERWLEAGELLGIAVESGVESLFGEERELAVAGPQATVVVESSEGEELLVELLTRGNIAAGDAKALLQEACPPDETMPCREQALESAGERIFDLGIAGYLLESARSSYDLGALASDYLGAPLGEATEDVPRAAHIAAAAHDLAEVLKARLDSDKSTACMRSIELPLVPVLVRMERVGVGIDTAVLQELATESGERIAELRQQIFEQAGCEFTIDSPKQLGEILFEKLGLPPQRKTKTGYSTDASVLAALAPMHPIAELVVAYRELTKLKSTYIDALPRLLGQDGRLHTSFNQTVAATGRLSSSNPNLQNIPVRTEFGRRIRAAFVAADEGELMVSADYSQIELRILAHLSGDAGLIEAFTSGMDFHQATAARVFGVDPEAVPPELRARAKAVNFGIVYGQSAHGLADSLGIAHAEAQAMIDRYYAAYPGVRTFLDETVAEAHRDGFATTLFGRKRRIPELRSSNYNTRAFGERTAMNHPMQGTAADIMKLAMIEVDRRLLREGFKSRMVLQVHDELVFEAPSDEIERLSAMACEAMSGVAELLVPLDVSVAWGANWAAAK